MTAINSRLVTVIRYSATLIKSIKGELRTIDKKTRKIIKMQRALHAQPEVHGNNDGTFYKRDIDN